MERTERTSSGESLQRLRRSRGLSLSETAFRADIPVASLRDWESGSHTPKGTSLSRLLDVLEPAEGERARLLALADPRFARIELAHTSLGAPVDVGRLLRGLRLRRKLTQTEAAARVGVGQSALAKWESGESIPSMETLQALLFALQASAEEAAAVICAVQADPCSLGTDEEAGWFLDWVQNETPFALREMLLLGAEAELWWRATRDERAKTLLCDVVSRRTHNLLYHGDLSEIDGLASRATRLAEESGAYAKAASAVFASCWLRRRKGGDPMGAARTFRQFGARFQARMHIDWFRSAEALALVQAGDHAGGLAILRTMESRIVQEEGEAAANYVRIDLIDAHLIAGQPERAARVLASMRGDAIARVKVQVAVALGEEPSPEELAEYERTVDPDNRLDVLRQKAIHQGLKRIRRKQGVVAR